MMSTVIFSPTTFTVGVSAGCSTPQEALTLVSQKLVGAPVTILLPSNTIYPMSQFNVPNTFNAPWLVTLLGNKNNPTSVTLQFTDGASSGLSFYGPGSGINIEGVYFQNVATFRPLAVYINGASVGLTYITFTGWSLLANVVSGGILGATAWTANNCDNGIVSQLRSIATVYNLQFTGTSTSDNSYGVHAASDSVVDLGQGTAAVIKTTTTLAICDATSFVNGAQLASTVTGASSSILCGSNNYN